MKINRKVVMLLATVFIIYMVVFAVRWHCYNLWLANKTLELEQAGAIVTPKPFLVTWEGQAFVFVSVLFLLCICFATMINERKQAKIIGTFFLFLLTTSYGIMRTSTVALATDQANITAFPYDVTVDVLCAYDDDFDTSKLGSVESAFEHANSFTSVAVEDCFEKNFGIHFNIVTWTSWDSNDNVHDPRQMVLEAWNEIGFYTGMVINGRAIEMLYLCTGQEIEGYYAVTFPDANITMAEGSWALLPDAVRHELSHQFYCPECSNFCVMNPTLLRVLDWCSNCESIIRSNKYKWIRTLTISVSNAGGTTDPAPGTYTYGYGSTVMVTATANSGYTFNYWLLDGATVYNNPITVTMDSDHTLSAYFVKLANLVVKVPQAPPEGVKVWVDGTPYTAYANSPVSVTVKAGQHTIEAERSFLKEGWTPGTYFFYFFDRWSDGSKDNPRTIQITSDTTLTAYYIRSKYGIQSEQPE